MPRPCRGRGGAGRARRRGDARQAPRRASTRTDRDDASGCREPHPTACHGRHPGGGTSKRRRVRVLWNCSLVRQRPSGTGEDRRARDLVSLRVLRDGSRARERLVCPATALRSRVTPRAFRASKGSFRRVKKYRLSRRSSGSIRLVTPGSRSSTARQSAFRRFSRSSTLTFSINCTFQSHSSGALARGIVTREVGDGGRRRVRGSAGQARAQRRGWRLLRRGARRNPRSGCPAPSAHRLVVTVRKFAHTRTKPLRRPSRPSFPVPDEPRSVPLDARRTRTPDTSTRGRSGPGTGSSPSSAADLSVRCAKRSTDAPGASSR